MVEMAVLELTARTGGLLPAAPALDKITASAVKTEAATTKSGTAISALGQRMAGAKSQIQNTAFQIGDFAVQVGAGTSASQALSQQLPQMLGGFGALGAVMGAVVAVGIPLVSAFMRSGEEAKTLDVAISDVNDTLSETKDIAALVQGGVSAMTDEFGRSGQEIQGLVDAQAQLSLRRLAEDADALAASMANLYNGNAWLNTSRAEQLAQALDLGTEATNLLDRGLTALSEAPSLDRQLEVATALRESFVMMVGPVGQMTSAQKDFYFGLVDTEQTLIKVNRRVEQLTPEFGMVRGAIRSANDAMSALTANVPQEGWLSGAISDATTLAATLWDAAYAAAATDNGISATATATTKGQGVIQDPNSIDVGQDSSGSGAINMRRNRSGGGGKTDPFASDFEALQASLLTQTEAEAANYEERQNLLLEALDRRAITQAEYNALYEAEEDRHAAAMSEIDTMRYGTGVEKAGAFFGAMAGAFQSGNERLQRIGRVFGALEAGVNAWRAFSQTIADPSLPWYAKVPAALSVLSAGLGAADAIKGGGGSASIGSVGSSSIGTASTAAASPEKVLRIEVKGEGIYAQMLRDHIGVIGEALTEQMNIGGFVVT